jgi:hypothetical protein
MKTYLSGGIEYAQDFGKNWRYEISEWLTAAFNHQIFNPTKESIIFFQEKFPGFKRSKLKELPVQEIRRIISSLVDFEIATIINDIDYVICFWDESCYKGAGTQGELTVAKYNNIPVYIVTQIDINKIPSWIIGCSTEIFKNFDELKTHLKLIYG